MASSRNWLFDVFPSFSGEDVRQTFLSHLLKELDRKLISAFKDSEIKKSQSIGPELEQAIRDSRIAVVIFSKNYASSSWCLDELLEIKKCKDIFGQLVIPIFYRLDPTHVRKQTGDFGEVFDKTCHIKTEDKKNQWKQALTDVANIHGYHSRNWGNEAKMIEHIANDVLNKFLSTASKDFNDFVGIDDHIAKMSVLLHMECEEVRMVGIWGSSGIGKTTIARALFSRLSRHFQSSIFIDRAFISKSMEIYSRGNPDDYNMKLNLQRNFLSEILDKKDIKIDHLGALAERLKYHKVLVIIDDLDDQVVLDTLAGQAQWFGRGSRIIAITKDKHILTAHGINHIYEVKLPSEKLALEILCQSAFRKNTPPHGYMELACEVVERVDSLPLGLNVLGSHLRGEDKEYWLDQLSRFRKGIDGKIHKTLRVSYDGLNNKEDKALFRHIACLFNYAGIIEIKKLLADSDLDVNMGLRNLNDNSLIQIRRQTVVMHSLLQEMGKEVVRSQSNEPGEREFLTDSKDICNVLEEDIGSRNVLGISLNKDEIDEKDELHVHNSAFKGMRNLRFLNIYTNKSRTKDRLHLLEGFNYLPPKLRLLSWDRYPMRCMPSKFCPKYLVKVKMQGSKLEKLWEGIGNLTCLDYMDLSGSENLKEIPDLSLATNLKTLNLSGCSSLVDLPLSIRNLNKLMTLEMSGCINLRTLPSGINLQSLVSVDLRKCSELNSVPDISTNISDLDLNETAIEEILSNLRLQNLVSLRMERIKSERLWASVQSLAALMTALTPLLTKLYLSNITSLVELPSSFQNLNKLEQLSITECIYLETLPNGMNIESLDYLNLSGCTRLRNFPDISTNISTLYLNNTGIEEVPSWIENFSKLRFLHMRKCFKLKCVSLNICKIKQLEKADFTVSRIHSNKASWCDSPSAVVMETDNVHVHRTLPSPKEDSSSIYVPKIYLKFVNCFILSQEALLQELSVLKGLIFPGEEVPSYFTHRSIGCSLTIPLLNNSLSIPFFRFRACAMVELDPRLYPLSPHIVIQICCRFRDRFGNSFQSFGQPHRFTPYHQKGSHLFIFDCRLLLNRDNATPDELNYNQVCIQFRIIEDRSIFILKGCGIRIFADHCPSPDNQPDNVSSTLGVARWALPHPTKRNVFKDLTLALNGAKQQFLKRRARGE
ncbi:PREDICTED: disease resistance protein RPS6-like isoform X1 [Brassica oleracea var. oleracea]|uniref:disease resistance protein RPS6-like isoform X1 n=1 Tax=Brassica oleracea var. oleracea TaxID=109376 RepID=UPI0006A6D1FA|nr:PREDICTED: disease resistance protein RPS6-like isoform X1 [Brassica oleracea var. oleracea]